MSFQDLFAPFPTEAISWRAQTISVRDGKASALALAYIDARDVMDRLDAVCGPENWQDSYQETPNGRILCSISIRLGDTWVSKSDGAGNTDVEGDKGAISDAFKRAAVKWGVGRYLYSLDASWVDCEVNERNGKHYFKCWTPASKQKFAKLLAAVGSGAGHSVDPQVSPPTPIDESQFAILTTLIEKSGADLRKICELHKIGALKELPADAFPILKAQLDKKLRKAAA